MKPQRQAQSCTENERSTQKNRTRRSERAKRVSCIKSERAALKASERSERGHRSRRRSVYRFEKFTRSRSFADQVSLGFSPSRMFLCFIVHTVHPCTSLHTFREIRPNHVFSRSSSTRAHLDVWVDKHCAATDMSKLAMCTLIPWWIDLKVNEFFILA